MLAYFLAFAVGIGSFILYMAAFFLPEVHRKNDFIWSGVGLFYALVLWVFAKRITGGLLLGHMASVALLGWLGWQTLSLRRQLTPKVQQTPVPSTEAVQNTIQQQVSKVSLSQRFAQLTKGATNAVSGIQGKTKEALSKKAPQATKSESIASVLNETETPQVTKEAVTPVLEQVVDTDLGGAETEAATTVEGEIADTTSASAQIETEAPTTFEGEIVDTTSASVQAETEVATTVEGEIVDTTSASAPAAETEAPTKVEGEIADTTSASAQIETEAPTTEVEQPTDNAITSATSNIEGVSEEITLEPPSSEAVEAGKKLSDYFEQKYPDPEKT